MVSVLVFVYPLVVNQDQMLIEGNILLQDSILQTFESLGKVVIRRFVELVIGFPQFCGADTFSILHF